MDTLNKILDLVKKRGLTQKSFAESIGLRDGAVTDWRKGKSKSYLKYIYQIADILDTTPDYLLGNTDIVIKTNPSLSKDKNTLLDKYDKLTDEQQKDVMQYMEFLLNKNNSD